MDDADVRLLAAMRRDPLGAVSGWAREAGLGDGTARARLARLKEDGVDRGLAAVPNGRLFDKEALVCIYPEATMPWEETLGWDGVIGASVNHEDVLALTCWVEPGGPPPAGVVDRLGEPARAFRQEDPPLQPAGAALSPLQWRILGAFIAEPRRAPADLARDLGVAAKTVRRHRDAFVAGGHVRLEQGLYAARGDHVLFHLYAQGAGTHPPEPVRAAVAGDADAWVEHLIAEPQGVLLFCHARSLADAAAAPKRALAVAGVQHAELVISKAGAYDVAGFVAAAAARASTT
ncbi:MAG: hypothetical protein ACPGQL_02565 [Thermoplasmatota archaeon]